MSYRRESLPLHGVAPDLIPQDAPAPTWNTASNAAFRNGESVAVGDDLPIFPFASINARTMVYVEPFDTGFWVYASEGGIFATDGSTEHDITPDSWTGFDASTVWTSCVINGLACINASTADPVYWTGDTAQKCEVLPGWYSGGRCLCMRAHKNFLFAIGLISVNGARVAWSDAAEAGVIPNEWTPSNTNLAGFVDLAPLFADCLDGAALRDELLVYKRKSVWAFTFVGGNDVFAARMVFHERGIAATNALTVGPDDQHLFIGSDGDIYMSDGVQTQSVLDGLAQRTFYSDFENAAETVFSAVTLMREKLSIVIYPAADAVDGTRALLLDWSSLEFGFRDMPNVLCAAEGRMLQDVGDQNTWDGQTDTWNEIQRSWNQRITAQSVQDVLIGGVGQIYQMGAAAQALPASLEKFGMGFGNPQKRKLVSRVWPKLAGRAGDVVNFRIGGQEVTGGPVALGPVQEYTIGSNAPLDLFWQGRFLAILVESGADVAPWRMGTLDVEFREVGGW